MARITVALPDPVVFRTQMTVQIGDINYGNHLANDAVLRLCHECRLRWLLQYGFSELDAGGCGLIMADAALQYVAQAYHGDGLGIEMGVADIGRSGFSLRYHIRNTEGEHTVAKVQTGMVCFDYAAQKISRIPPKLLAALEVYSDK